MPPEVTATTRAAAGPLEQRQQPADQHERPDDHRREASPRCRPGRRVALRVDRAGVVDRGRRAAARSRGSRRDRRAHGRQRAPCRRPRSGSGPRRARRPARRGRAPAAPRSGRPGRPGPRARASASAVARPRPDVGPVTSTVLPGQRPIRRRGPAEQPSTDLVAEREKLPTTVTSRASSISDLPSTSSPFVRRAHGRMTGPELEHTEMTKLHERIETTLPHRRDLRLHRRLRELEPLGPGRRDLRADRRRTGRPRRPLPPRRPDARPRRADGVPDHRPSSRRRRVVLTGEGSGVSAVDEIRFEPTGDRARRIDYTADIRLGGWMRLVQPFVGGAFEKIAKDALGGMQRALDERAAARASHAMTRPVCGSPSSAPGSAA